MLSGILQLCDVLIRLPHLFTPLSCFPRSPPGSCGSGLGRLAWYSAEDTMLSSSGYNYFLECHPRCVDDRRRLRCVGGFAGGGRTCHECATCAHDSCPCGPGERRHTHVNAILMCPIPSHLVSFSDCLPAIAPSVASSPSLSLILERALCQEYVEGGGGIDECWPLAGP